MADALDLHACKVMHYINDVKMIVTSSVWAVRVIRSTIGENGCFPPFPYFRFFLLSEVGEWRRNGDEWE